MTNTALGYQMMYEGEFLRASITAIQNARYRDAAELAKLAAIFMGVEQLPTSPVYDNDLASQLKARDYAFKILNVLAKTGNTNLINVRRDYKGDIPR